MKVLFYVQYLLGIGHVRRASLICEALIAAGADVTVAFGGFPVPVVKFPGAHVIQLPPVRTADATFATVLDAHGQPIDDAWKEDRTHRLVGIFADLQPDALIVETYPFGRRRFRFELEPLLQLARSNHGTLVVSSVRDILVAKSDPAKVAYMAESARRWFHFVMVHGDPDLIPLDATFSRFDQVADLIRYTGYLIPQRPAVPSGGAGDGDGEVIISAGGGAVGDVLLRTALAARPMTPLATAPWRFLLGQEVPSETARVLRDAADSGVIVEPARPDFPALLRRCRLSISQAGYNTVMDILAAGCRSILVPSAEGGQSEQTIRARLLADRDIVQMVEEEQLSPEALAKAVSVAIAGTPAPSPHIRMDGCATTARLIFEGMRRLRSVRSGH